MASTSKRKRRSLTHIDSRGAPRMVDISEKPRTERRALARAVVEMREATLDEVLADRGPKGPVLGVARIAGTLAAKRTAELIPLCHPLPLTAVTFEFERIAKSKLEIRSEVRTIERTGVEMEALAAVTIAALTVYDMAKAMEKGIRITDVELLEKDGGKSGPWRRKGRA